ncbi:MAG: hypothetical protein U5J98_00535 [Halobacteriales archaeon]|nr:hypothetical protein [Halobacteriales archaeon]
MATAHDGHDGGDLTDHLQPFAGLGQGISAFIVGYLAVTALWFVDAAVTGGSMDFGGLVFGGLERLLASHLGVAGGPPLTAGSSTGVPAAAYLLVPVVVLGYNGWTIASRHAAPSARAAAVAGASTVVGYAVAVLGSVAALAFLVDALLGALGVTVVTGALAGAVSSPRTFAVAGVLYPVAFGGLGGYAAYRWRQRDS